MIAQRRGPTFQVAAAAAAILLAGAPARAADGRLEVSLPPAAELAAEDAARDVAGLPWRYAVPEAVRVVPGQDGTWERQADGSRRWRLEVASPGALSLNLGFTIYWLPESATLSVRAAGGEVPPLVFDAGDNADHGELWTPVLLTDALVVELVVPPAATVEPLLELGFVNSGYRYFGTAPQVKSGACNIDVVCPEGDGWRDEIATVGLVSVGGSLVCTGAMVNNTAYDRTPYFLTANHCGISASRAPSVVVYWNYESPACGQQGGGSLAQFTSGATLRATWATTDVTLVELDELPDANFGVKYAGWNRGETPPASATGIHHPDVDEKSISFETSPVLPASYLAEFSPGNGSHLRVVDWDLGTTEQGSSGSPLFDQDQLVVGQLHGGHAACGNDESDWYGRLYGSWEGGGTSETRLSDWLDPAGTGVVTLPLLDPSAGDFSVVPADVPGGRGPVGGPFTPTSWDFTLVNDGEDVASFTTSIDRDWLAVSPASGFVPAGGQVVVTATLTASAGALRAGTHTAVVDFGNPGGGAAATRTITLDAVAPMPTIVDLGPNPFREAVTVHVSLPAAGTLAWRVYDLRGRLVRGESTQAGTEGQNTLTWDGRDDGGRRLPSGVYVLAISSGGHEVRQEVVSGH
ncbi:MAG: T9SS type A sorting domain-containing protein [bacterium]|nr:T9SS type A sorting domain-containing protein [bacterium]